MVDFIQHGDTDPGDPLALLEALLRVADASGEPVTFAALADIVRNARSAQQAPERQPSPRCCPDCEGIGRVPIFKPNRTGGSSAFVRGSDDWMTCDRCEGTGMPHPPTTN